MHALPLTTQAKQGDRFERTKPFETVIGRIFPKTLFLKQFGPPEVGPGTGDFENCGFTGEANFPGGFRALTLGFWEHFVPLTKI